MKKIALFAGGLCIVASSACHKTNHGGTSMIDKLNGTDSNFLIQASYGNYGEAAAGVLADSLASLDSVKMFGAMMVTDHMKAQLSLDSIGNKWDISLPVTPDAEYIAAAKVLATLSGTTFDTTYLSGQVKDHLAAQALYQNELDNGHNTQILDYASRILPVVKMHLDMAESLNTH